MAVKFANVDAFSLKIALSYFAKVSGNVSKRIQKRCSMNCKCVKYFATCTYHEEITK